MDERDRIMYDLLKERKKKCTSLLRTEEIQQLLWVYQRKASDENYNLEPPESQMESQLKSPQLKKETEEMRGCFGVLGEISLYSILLFSTCSNNSDIRQLENKVDMMQTKYTCLEHFLPAAKTENVYGNDMPEQYYEINGKRYYFVVDGKRVEPCSIK